MNAKLVGAIAIVIVLAGLIFIFSQAGYTRIEQDELAFKYNVESGKPVSPQENPLLPFGWNLKWGIHTKFFRVSSQSHQFTFTESTTQESPYNEAATFDSSEGTTMLVDYTITAKVSDIWKFYANYGINQYQVPAEAKNITDPRLYEAIREAGAYVNVVLPETAQNIPAVVVRQSFTKFNADLSRLTAKYMEQFGLQVEQVILSGNFRYPSGNVVQETTNRLGDKNSEVEKRQREKETAEGKKQQAIAEAQIRADSIISEAQKEAERLTAEAQAIAAEMQALVKQLGREKTVQFLINREVAELISQGKVSESYFLLGT